MSPESFRHFPVLTRLRHCSIILLFLLIFIEGSSQKIFRGQVTDGHTEEPLPFSSILSNRNNEGIFADSTGRFILHFQTETDSVTISSAGYSAITINLFSTADTIFPIRLTHNAAGQDVILKASVNKGLYLWNKIMERKKQFDPWERENYCYEQYNKTGVNIRNLNLNKLNRNIFLKPFSFILNPLSEAVDSAGIIPAYLIESNATCCFQKVPKKKKEFVNAINNRGFLEKSSLGILEELNKETNIFSDFIRIMNHDFAGPFHKHANSLYNFWVADTQKLAEKIIFHLVFEPASRTGNLFSGDAWIEAGSFRLIRASLFLGKESGLNFISRLSIFQEFIPGPDSTLVTKREKVYADINSFGSRAVALNAQKYSVFSDYSVSNNALKDNFEKQASPYASVYSPSAFSISDSAWDKIRPDTLDLHDKLVYQMIDRLANDSGEYHQLKDKFKFLGSGYLNIGKFEIGRWFSVFSGNQWEGFRTRIDFGTNKKFSKNIHFHSYLAYGTKDKKLKGLGEIFWIPNRGKYWTQLHTRYISDIDNRVSQPDAIGSDNIFSLLVRKPGSKRRFLHIRQFTFSLRQDLGSGFRIEGYSSLTQVTPLKNLPPAANYPPQTGSGKPLTTAEVAFKLRFAPGEKLITGDFFRYPLAHPYPVIQLTAGYGFPGFAGSDYRYWRMGADITGVLSLKRAGKLYYNFFAERYFGTIPFPFLPSVPGNDGYVYSSRVNNLLYRYEYLSDRNVGYRLEHNTGQGIFQLFSFTRKLRWTQFWNIRMTWSEISQQNELYNTANSFFKTPNGKPYVEIGTGIENIFRIFRLDLVWRLLPEPLPSEKVSRFGIFGSFKFRL